MHPAITYSLLAVCAAFFGAGIWVEGRKDGARFASLRRYGLPAQALAVVLAVAVLRPGRGDDGRRALAASASANMPLLVDIYSNW